MSEQQRIIPPGETLPAMEPPDRSVRLGGETVGKTTPKRKTGNRGAAIRRRFALLNASADRADDELVRALAPMLAPSADESGAIKTTADTISGNSRGSTGSGKPAVNDVAGKSNQSSSDCDKTGRWRTRTTDFLLVREAL